MATLNKTTFVYWWNQYQLLDWVLLVVLFIIGSALSIVKPFCRTFSWNDATIDYPMQPDTFPNYSLYIMIVLAAIFYIGFILLLVKPLQRLLGEPLELYALGASNGGAATWDAYADVPSDGPVAENPRRAARVRDMQTGCGPLYPWIRAHCWSVGLAFFVMAFLKVYAGRLRPDYLARLAAAGYTGKMDNLPSPGKDPQFYCNLMDTHPDLMEGRLSFPSGHSSMSFSVFVVVSCCLFAHLRPFARQGSFVRLCISLAPLIVPIMCAVSRTRDNKHHFADILAGSLIGIFSGLIGFYGSFRSVGGPTGIYYARTTWDREYDLLRDPTEGPARADVNINGSGDQSEFGATNARNDGGLRRTATSVEVPVGDVPAGGIKRIGLTERMLNEDAAAVAWI